MSSVTSTAWATYTKIANNGTDLPASATQGSGATDWACTRDDATGLVWEIKTAANANDTYTFADANTKYPGIVNAAKLCGYTDWRLPSWEELAPLVGTTVTKTCQNHMDPVFFDVAKGGFWTAATYTYYSDTAGIVNFCLGLDQYDRASVAYEQWVRLVRGGKLFDSLPATATMCNPVALTMNVTAIPGWTTTPYTFCTTTYDVSVYDGATKLCTTPVAADGSGTCNALFTSAGKRDLRVEYTVGFDQCTTSGRTYVRNETATLTVDPNPTIDCLPGAYISKPTTTTACQVCAPCLAGTVSSVKNAPSCSACAPGTFAATSGLAACVPFTQCAAGTYVATAGSATTDQSCAPCLDGKTTSGANQVACLECAPGTYVETPAGPATEPTCKACPAGTFSASLSVASCTAYATCPAGRFIAKPGTSTSEPSCEPCGAGSFSSAPDQPACTPYTPCEYVAVAGTATSDQVCGTPPAQDAGADAADAGGDARDAGRDVDAGNAGTNDGSTIASPSDDDSGGCSIGAAPSQAGGSIALAGIVGIAFVRRRRRLASAARGAAST